MIIQVYSSCKLDNYYEFLSVFVRGHILEWNCDSSIFQLIPLDSPLS